MIIFPNSTNNNVFRKEIYDCFAEFSALSPPFVQYVVIQEGSEMVMEQYKNEHDIIDTLGACTTEFPR